MDETDYKIHNDNNGKFIVLLFDSGTGINGKGRGGGGGGFRYIS